MKTGLRRVILALAAVALATGGTTVALGGCIGDDPGRSTSPSRDGGPAETGTANPCDEYCNTVSSKCTGTNEMYASVEDCKLACSFLEVGDPADTNRNTVHCRLNQARTATTLQQCAASGPYGGAVCGQRCQAFCRIASGNCSRLGAAAPYPDDETCLSTCNNLIFKPDAGESTHQPVLYDGTNTLNCREYHLQLSFKDNARATHCPHAGRISALCNIDGGP